jgi:hypothetical protein
MGRLSPKHLLIFIIIISAAFSNVDGQTKGKTEARYEKSLHGKPKKVKTKDKKVKESRKVTQAKNAQKKKEDKLKKDYNNYVADSKKRAYQIQSPEVKSRMNQNQKDIKEREKAKKKKQSVATKPGAVKYKK